MLGYILFIFLIHSIAATDGYACTITSPSANIRVSNVDPLPLTVNISSGDYRLLITASCNGKARYTYTTFTQFNEQINTKIPDSSMNQCTDSYMNISVRLNQTTGPDSVDICTSIIEVYVISDGLSIWYIVCSLFSMLSCFLLIFLYAKYPTLRKFPSNLIFWRTINDLVFSLQLIILNGYELHNGSSAGVCNAAVAFLTQFNIFASLGWYFVLSLNFYFSISNPFRRPASKTIPYHVFVWGTSLVTASITAINHGYRQDYRFCWNAKQDDFAGINVTNWVTYFIWIVVFSVLSLVILIYGVRKLRSGMLKKTLQMREEILRQTRLYVITFSIYWGIAAIIWYAIFFFSSGDNQVVQYEYLSYLFAIVVGSLGDVDAAIWIASHWPVLKRLWKKLPTEDPEVSEFGDISDALRFEFIQRTSEGIIASLKDPELKDAMGPSPEMILERKSVEFDNMAQRLLSDNSDEKPKSYILEGSMGYTFIAYAVGLFAKLRNVFGVTETEFMTSISGAVELMKKNFSEGASGSFFYYTADQRFMIKTLTPGEHHFLLRILKRYVKYMSKYPKSLLCRFFGMFSIHMYGHTEYLVVMNNFLKTGSYKIDEKYDLKGSKINRHASVPKKVTKTPTWKDNDLKKQVRLHPAMTKEVIVQLCHDSQFLRSLQIMDYSLLLGFHNCTELRLETKHCNGLELKREPTSPSPTSPSSDGFSSSDSKRTIELPLSPINSQNKDQFVVDVSTTEPGETGGTSPYENGLPARVIIGPGIYHLGIIDMLQAWDLNKRTEQWLKILFRCHCGNYRDLSAVEPNYYSERFIAMLEKVFEIPPDVQFKDLIPAPDSEV